LWRYLIGSQTVSRSNWVLRLNEVRLGFNGQMYGLWFDATNNKKILISTNVGSSKNARFFTLFSAIREVLEELNKEGYSIETSGYLAYHGISAHESAVYKRPRHFTCP
jgi:hypothetical protein